MRRDQLEHAIRAACEIIGADEIIIVGSQSILGSYGEHELPPTATMSVEIDVLPIAEDDAEVERLGNLIEGVAGELSLFEQTHGFSIDGVGMSTSALPAGWRERLVKVQKKNTAPPSGHPQFVGWCLDKHDLCVAKLCAFREKDRSFVAALLKVGLIERDIIAARLPTVPDRTAASVDPALEWLESLT